MSSDPPSVGWESYRLQCCWAVLYRILLRLFGVDFCVPACIACFVLLCCFVGHWDLFHVFVKRHLLLLLCWPTLRYEVMCNYYFCAVLFSLRIFSSHRCPPFACGVPSFYVRGLTGFPGVGMSCHERSLGGVPCPRHTVSRRGDTAGALSPATRPRGRGGPCRPVLLSQLPNHLRANGLELALKRSVFLLLPSLGIHRHTGYGCRYIPIDIHANLLTILHIRHRKFGMRLNARNCL